MTGRIAIALGDPTGIGPEVALKALATELAADDARYLLIGDEPLARHWNEKLGLRLDLQLGTNAPASARILIHQPATPFSARPSPLAPRPSHDSPTPLSHGSRTVPNAVCAAKRARSSPRRSARKPSSARATQTSSDKRNFFPSSRAPTAP